MKVHETIEQGSEEWLALRAGKATASEFSSILAKGQGKTRAAYLRRLVTERLLGHQVETYKNAHMERGQAQEPLARLAYEAATDRLLRRVAFVEHDTLAAGCSPDSLVVGERRGVEVKCVIPTVQVETILSGKVPPEHIAQIQGGMWITECEQWDFVSYSPSLPQHLRTFIVTVPRDDGFIKELESEVRKFLAEVDATVGRLNAEQLRRAA